MKKRGEHFYPNGPSGGVRFRWADAEHQEVQVHEPDLGWYVVGVRNNATGESKLTGCPHCLERNPAAFEGAPLRCACVLDAKDERTNYAWAFHACDCVEGVDA